MRRLVQVSVLAHFAVQSCELVGSVALYATDDGPYYGGSITDTRSDLVGDTLTFHVLGCHDGSAANQNYYYTVHFD